MSEAIKQYRGFLSRGARDNQTGLPNNVWAMLMTLDHFFAITNQSYIDNRQDIRKLTSDLHAIKTRGDSE